MGAVDHMHSRGEFEAPRMECGKEFLMVLMAIEATALLPSSQQLLRSMDVKLMFTLSQLGSFISGTGISRQIIGSFPIAPFATDHAGALLQRHQVLPFCSAVDFIERHMIHPLFYSVLATQPLNKIRPASGFPLEDGEILQNGAELAAGNNDDGDDDDEETYESAAHIKKKRRIESRMFSANSFRHMNDLTKR